ncbi:uncharacterized protein LOC106659694 [Trichogramma pretiosum]|uniref:uncharacterized protein LOC106659694 n=1 Tax=Trichogramma pretiosum TaxID=7493 RepID=UPI0006C9CDF5|nr:uncharacterized protein LOC106659694 [Trichogramma pretiosum]
MSRYSALIVLVVVACVNAGVLPNPSLDSLTKIGGPATVEVVEVEPVQAAVTGEASARQARSPILGFGFHDHYGHGHGHYGDYGHHHHHHYDDYHHGYGGYGGYGYGHLHGHHHHHDHGFGLFFG